MADPKVERAKTAERTRDAERTREAILVAAEDCFARLGFDGTSLQQIGEAAAVARSTPAYFFGSKKALYDAVLARVIARAQEAMARAYAAEDGNRSAEEAAASYVSAFLDLTALCWYPFANEHTLMPALGIKARNPAFLDEQKRHLGKLVRALTRSGS